MEGLAGRARNVGRVLEQVAVLDDRIRDAGDVGLLERVLAEHRRDLLAAEHDDRHGIHLGGQEARHRIGRAGSRRDEHDAGLAGGARVAVGHVRRALFMSHEDQLDNRIDECVEDRHGCAARVAEHVFDTFSFEALNQLLCAGRHSIVMFDLGDEIKGVCLDPTRLLKVSMPGSNRRISAKNTPCGGS